MNTHDLKADLFLTPEETAALFRRDVAWVYRQRNQLLKPAARTFGRKHLLFLKTELLHILQRPPE